MMYGIESIDGWMRLLTVIPKDYRELIDNAKTQVDFWVNVGFLSSLLLLEYAGLAIFTRTLGDWWIALIILLAFAFAPHFAQNSAIEWGDFIKAAFDVYTPKLRESLNIISPADRDEEQKQWVTFSQAIGYRLPEQLPELKNPEKEKDEQNNNG